MIESTIELIGLRNILVFSIIGTIGIIAYNLQSNLSKTKISKISNVLSNVLMYLVCGISFYLFITYIQQCITESHSTADIITTILVIIAGVIYTSIASIIIIMISPTQHIYFMLNRKQTK